MFELDDGNPNDLEGLVHIYAKNNVEECCIKYFALTVEFIHPDSFQDLPIYSSIDYGSEMGSCLFGLKFYNFDDEEILDYLEGDIKYIGEHSPHDVTEKLTQQGLLYGVEYLKQCTMPYEQDEEEKEVIIKPGADFKKTVGELIGRLCYSIGQISEERHVLDELNKLCQNDKQLLRQFNYLKEEIEHYPQIAAKLAERRLFIISFLPEERFEECDVMLEEIKQMKKNYIP